MLTADKISTAKAKQKNNKLLFIYLIENKKIKFINICFLNNNKIFN